MHLVDDLLPSSDLVGVETTRNVRVSSSDGVDERRLGDQQGAGFRRALAVVFDGEVLVDVVLVGAETGQGSHSETVLELHASDTDRLEEGGAGGHAGGLIGFGGGAEIRIGDRECVAVQ